jgi:hypothetical protein
MNIMALESIDFQDGEFFQALTSAVGNIRKDKKSHALSNKNFFESDCVIELADVIKKYTNIMIEFSEGDPAIYPPALTGNHVFYDRGAVAYYKEVTEFDDSEDVNKIMKAMKIKVIQGSVDIKLGKVYGVFAQMLLDMLMPKEMLCGVDGGKIYEDDEVAAIILHETGHAFTFMEFCDRGLSTNQAIAGLTRALDKSISADKRMVIFDKAAKQLDLSKERTKALKEAKTEAQVSVIVLDDAIEKSISELGYSVYDVNSCEYLADQFAARQGASKALVTALDKIFKRPLFGGGATMWFIGAYVAVMVTFIIVSTAGVIIPVWFLLMLAFTDKKNDIYDNPYARMKRIKLQNVERLKNKDLSAKVKVVLLEENEAIEKCMRDYQDKLGLIEKIAYFLKPSYRNAHKYELLQKELEDFASSDMFSAAAKLKMV